MPLVGYQSLCQKNAPQIVSRDKGNSQYHKGINKDSSYVTHYQIDGVVIKEGSRCDFLLINEGKKNAYLIELKGSDIVKAANQLEQTAKTLASQLNGYNLFYRIVANRCATHAINSSEYRKFQVKWRGKLIQKTGFIEENI